jgi:hypothetical protein
MHCGVVAARRVLAIRHFQRQVAYPRAIVPAIVGRGPAIPRPTIHSVGPGADLTGGGIGAMACGGSRLT